MKDLENIKCIIFDRELNRSINLNDSYLSEDNFNYYFERNVFSKKRYKVNLLIF